MLLEHLWGKGVDWCGKGVDQGRSATLKWPSTCLMANNVPSSGHQSGHSGRQWPRACPSSHTCCSTAMSVSSDSTRARKSSFSDSTAPAAARDWASSSERSSSSEVTACLMREAIGGHQRSSEVIRGHQSSSSEVTACLMGEAIGGHQRSSEVIRGHQRSSSEVTACLMREAIGGHQKSSEVIRGHQRSSSEVTACRLRRMSDAHASAQRARPAAHNRREAIRRRAVACGERGAGAVVSTCMRGAGPY